MKFFPGKKKRDLLEGDLERERSFLRSKGGQSGGDDLDGGRGVEGWYKWVIGFALLIFITLLYPTRQAFIYNLNVENITEEAIVSPLTFSIRKSDDDLNRELAAARANVPPVLEFNDNITARQSVRLDTLLSMLAAIPVETGRDSLAIQNFSRAAPEVSEETLTYLFAEEIAGRAPERRLELATLRIDSLRQATEEVVDHLFSLGVVESLPQLREVSSGTVILDTGEEEIEQRLEIIIDLRGSRDGLAGQLRARLVGADEHLVKGGVELIQIILAPNLILNEERTEFRRNEAADAIPINRGIVLKDEEIIGANKRVTQEVLETLRSLQVAMAEADEQRGWWPVTRTWFARLLLIALVLGIYISYVRVSRRSILVDNRQITTIALLIAVEMALAYVLRQTGLFSTYMVPVAVATMLLTVLLDTGIGLVTAFVLGLLLGSVMGFDYPITIIHTAAGAAGVFAVHRVRKRSHFYRALWAVPLIYAAGIVSVEMLQLSPFQEASAAVAYGVFNGMLSVVIAMGLLPIFESLFRFTTDITLLELSDLNHPLLRQLAMKAPGTYQHSLMMGELGAAAAEACGANALLTRVGAYFHDVGKLNKPEYFVENQSGKNPHGRLSPHMSSLIVETHVKEGLELTEEYKLPSEISAFIPEHHGTMPMTYFYLRAVEEAENGAKVNEDDFRYDGPKPQSRETGIIMLADAVEAASRVMDHPNPRRIRTLVKELVERRFEDGELDDCPLTLRDLRLVQNSFVNILTSRFHQRIDYPDKDETLKKAADREAAARRKEKESISSQENNQEQVKDEDKQ